MYQNHCLSYCFLFITLFSVLTLSSQTKPKIEDDVHLRTKPKLVVGIVVDQMRYDYLTRFYNHYGNGGFKRMISEGFNCKNHQFNYMTTGTGPGHASVYTGTTPAMHGIIGNDWYDKQNDKSVYCVGDNNYASVGTISNAGKMSPHRMTVTTVSDELRLHTQMRGKTISIALKDRGAVLPGGHTANAAYWFQGKDEGKWISSTYYMDKLPTWVNDFNSSGIAQSYKKTWTTLKNIDTYIESGLDNNNYEGLSKGETTPTFPHNSPDLLDKNKNFDAIKSTPYGNSLTTDFAIQALEKEGLGMDEDTDFLAISFSSTDYVGHKYGVNSKEIEDTYLRLDSDLERLLIALDQKVGKGEYTVFLTSDHAAGEVNSYLKDMKIPAGYVNYDETKTKFSKFLKNKYATENIVKNISNMQIFLDYKIIEKLGLNLVDVEEDIAKEYLTYDYIDFVYTGHQMWQNEYLSGIPSIVQKGYNQKRSGDVLWVLRPNYIRYRAAGSGHGSPHIYDRHAPLIFFGKGIKKGSMVQKTETPDIAPTISVLLGISFPSGNTGKPIDEVLD